MRRPRCFLLLLPLLAISCGESTDGGDRPGDPDDPDADDPIPPYDPAGRVDYAVELGYLGTIYQPSATSEIAAQVGRGFAIDTVAPDGSSLRRVFSVFSQHDDVASAPQVGGRMVSLDGGATFGAYASGIEIPPLFAVELKGGRVLSYGFVPTDRVDSANGSTLTLHAEKSPDQGESWQPMAASAALPRMSGGTGSRGRLSGHPIQLADGTILLPWYGSYAGDTGGARAELLASSDGGRTFARRGSIAVPPAGRSYPEPDIVELPDGSLYAVVRHHVIAGNGSQTLSTLLWTRSSDGGVTWAAPRELMVSFGDQPAAPRIGINPQLMLLPNGVLVLSSGRPDNFVAVSTSQSADSGEVTWRLAQMTYRNYPSATTAAYGEAVLRYHGSSGNTGLVTVEANRAIQIGDNCAAGWGCPPADSSYHVDGRYRVWRRYIEVVTPEVGKIDLASKLARGAVTVETDMTWTSPAHRRAGPAGAVDGSTDYWSSAVGEGGSGTFVIRLDRAYDLTRIGLSVRRGLRGSAEVYASRDGERWDEPAIAGAPGRTHRAMEYFPLASPVRARAIKVVVDSDAPCDDGLAAACAFLNEIELYSTIDSFENDPVGAPPRGYSSVASAWVTDYQAGETRRALRMVDSSDTVIAGATWLGAPGVRKTFAFSLEPIDLPNGFLFGVRGVDEGGGRVDLYHLGVMADGSVAHYDFAAARWLPMSGPDLIQSGTRHRIAVTAGTDGATVDVDDEELGTVEPAARAASVDAHYFSSAGTATIGDQVLIDDVYFQ